MTATLGVRCSAKSLVQDRKDQRKDNKEVAKESKESGKEMGKESGKESAKEAAKEILKERKDMMEQRVVRSAPVANPGHLDMVLSDLEARVQMLESALAALVVPGAGQPAGRCHSLGMAQPFIDASLRPDLAGGPAYNSNAGGHADLPQRMAAGDRDAKRAFDAPVPR
jgi:hypothetical protein